MDALIAPIPDRKPTVVRRIFGNLLNALIERDNNTVDVGTGLASVLSTADAVRAGRWGLGGDLGIAAGSRLAW